jgi:hypothetical protein
MGRSVLRRSGRACRRDPGVWKGRLRGRFGAARARGVSGDPQLGGVADVPLRSSASSALLDAVPNKWPGGADTPRARHRRYELRCTSRSVSTTTQGVCPAHDASGATAERGSRAAHAPALGGSTTFLTTRHERQRHQRRMKPALREYAGPPRGRPRLPRAMRGQRAPAARRGAARPHATGQDQAAATAESYQRGSWI